MLFNAGIRSGAEIGDSERGAGLVIQLLSDNALKIVAINKAITAAVVQRPAGASFGLHGFAAADKTPTRASTG